MQYTCGTFPYDCKCFVPDSNHGGYIGKQTADLASQILSVKCCTLHSDI